MSTAAERALRKSIRDGTFDRVYYFHGDEDYLKDGLVRDLVAAALDPATREFNVETLRGGEVTAETLDTILSTPPMFAARRVVILRDVHALRKDARASVTRYLAHPAADAVLVLVDPSGEKPDREFTEQATDVGCERLAPNRVPAWIAHQASTVLDVQVTDGAVALLQEACGAELPVLAAELDKLASYTGGAAIDEAAVAAVVGVRHGESVADLLDAVAVRDGGRAAALVPIVLSQPKTNLVTIIMSLATQTTAIAWGRAARDRGVPAAGVERGFYSLLKEGKAFPGRAWKDAVSCWTRALAAWPAADLDRALGDLLRADMAAKEARVSSEEQLLTSLVLSLCTPLARAAA